MKSNNKELIIVDNNINTLFFDHNIETIKRYGKYDVEITTVKGKRYIIDDIEIDTTINSYVDPNMTTLYGKWSEIRN